MSNGEHLLRFGHIELFVKDPIQSQEFYCGVLGFELVSNQNNQFVWIKKDSIEILLRPGSLEKKAN